MTLPTFRQFPSFIRLASNPASSLKDFCQANETSPLAFTYCPTPLPGTAPMVPFLCDCGGYHRLHKDISEMLAFLNNDTSVELFCGFFIWVC